MALLDPWGHDGKTFDGKEMRLLVDAIFQGTGVVGTNDFLVEQQSSPGPTVKVRAGSAIVSATTAGLFGKYHQANDASLNSPSFTATSANGRKDRLILRITSGVAALEIVQGVASGSPAEPSITGDNYTELALVTLPGSTTNITTAMITDRRGDATTLTSASGTLPGGYARKTSDQTGITTVTDLTGLTVTVTILTANELIRITGFGNFHCASGNAGTSFLIREGSTTLATAKNMLPYFFATSLDEGASTVSCLLVAPTVGVHTYKLSFVSNASASLKASSTQPAYILVENIGAS